MLLRLLILFALSPFAALAIVFLALALALQLAVPSVLWVVFTPLAAAAEVRQEWTKWRARS